MIPSRALTCLLLAASVARAEPPRADFDALFRAAHEKARAAYLRPAPILAALGMRELEALSDERVPSVTAPGARRDRVVEFLAVLEKVAQLQGRAGLPALSSRDKVRLTREVAEYFRLSEEERREADSEYRVAQDGVPGPFADAAAYHAAALDLNRAGGAAALIGDGAAGWTGREAGGLPPGGAAAVAGGGPRPAAASPALPGAQLPAGFVRSARPPPPPNSLVILAGMRERAEAGSRAANARLDDEFRERYQQASLIFKDASEYWSRQAEGDFRPGDSVAGATLRATVGTIAHALVEPFRRAEQNVQRLAYTRSDDRYSRRTGEESSWRPDGFGITVVLSNGVTRRSFRDPAQGKAFLEGLPPSGAKRVIFYGHGAPGMQTVGDDFYLEAEDVRRLLAGKVLPGGRVDLIGCNTASIGERSIEDGNVAGMAGFGLSSYIRRVMYNRVPAWSGDQAVAAQWNRDLARETSRELPGVYVTGMRTFAFPLDRLVDLFVPGGNDPTPSDVIIGRRAVYLNGEETRL